MCHHMAELRAKQSHDANLRTSLPFIEASPCCDQAIIVGGGPSGMATAALLRKHGVPHVILERSDCIASLWKERTYDRLHLHIAKQYCELPLAPFPESYPTFLSREQFVDYLEDYAKKFDIFPQFNETVQGAEFDRKSETWRVSTIRKSADSKCSMETKVYEGKWLVVATGENAEVVLPPVPGIAEFKGKVSHSSVYKNGSEYTNKRVLVVGCGNAGMEIALDLINSGAKCSLVVRSPLHILPREMFGKSTFSVAMMLTKVLPVWLVDYLLVSYCQMTLGDTSAYGIRRPKVGPLELKNKMGKTPILDVGTLKKIQSGDIKVKPGIDCVTESGARFSDGSFDTYDAVIFATGYRSVVPSWLKDEDCFFNDRGLPSSSQQCWKGPRGLYAAGLSGKGLLGVTMDAQRIAEDIKLAYSASHLRNSQCI